MAIGSRGLVLNDLDSLWRFSNYVAKSGMAPKGMERPESIFVAVQLGLELGLTPMAALQNTAVINGRPGIFGDAALALVRSSGLLEDWEEHFGLWCDECEAEGGPNCPRCKKQLQPEQRGAIVSSRRVGSKSSITSGFNVRQAKLAGLWEKTNRDGSASPWKAYPNRMLKFRARGFNLRDNFGDVLKGLRTTEELADIQSGEVIDLPHSVREDGPPVGRHQLGHINPKRGEGRPIATPAPVLPGTPKAIQPYEPPVVTRVAQMPTSEPVDQVEQGDEQAELPSEEFQAGIPVEAAQGDLAEGEVPAVDVDQELAEEDSKNTIAGVMIAAIHAGGSKEISRVLSDLERQQDWLGVMLAQKVRDAAGAATARLEQLKRGKR